MTDCQPTPASPAFYSPTCLGYILKLTVSPGASRTRVVGLYGDRLKVRLAAPPEKGAANEELLDFLARILQVSRQNLRLRGGARSRTKVVEVCDLSPELGPRLQHLGAPQL